MPWDNDKIDSLFKKLDELLKALKPSETAKPVITPKKKGRPKGSKNVKRIGHSVN